MPYVEFTVEPGHGGRHRALLPGGLGAPSVVARNGGAVAARVTVGPAAGADLPRDARADPALRRPPRRRSTSRASPARTDGSPERGLVTEESNWYQYRFEDIVDPDTGRVLFTIEHEVRSLRSPLYLRPLVNRNVAQRQPTYQRGRDAFVPGMS